MASCNSSKHFYQPVGLFWDIENVQVPKRGNVSEIVKRLRKKFLANKREAVFTVVCDVTKSKRNIIQPLCMAQVTVIHEYSESKNAIDEKLKSEMRRFVDHHGADSTLILLSGDVNFSTDFSDFKYRHKVKTILIHRDHVHHTLLDAADEVYKFSEFTNEEASEESIKETKQLVVENLPTDVPTPSLKGTLKQHFATFGGKISCIKEGKAIISFSSSYTAKRAKKALQKTEVSKNIITIKSFYGNVVDFETSPFLIDAEGSSSSDAEGSESLPIQEHPKYELRSTSSSIEKSPEDLEERETRKRKRTKRRA